MSAMEQFPYWDRDPTSGGLDLMPDLPILLRHQSVSVSALGLVDSGASINVMPHHLGLQLGFQWDQCKKRITLGGVLAGVEAKGILVEAVVGQLGTAPK